MKKAFVSFAPHDLSQAEMLADDLRRMGWSVWLDTSLVGGESWWEQILEEIRSADLFVFALSSHSWRSKECRTELEYAEQLRIPVLPVTVGPMGDLRYSKLAEGSIPDYRSRTSDATISLLAAVAELTAEPVVRPEPLPLPPPVPFGYLFELAKRVDADRLTPADQMALLDQLREVLRDEIDDIARADIRTLLGTLGDRPDTTVAIYREIVALLGSPDRDDPAGRPPGSRLPMAAVELPGSNVVTAKDGGTRSPARHRTRPPPPARIPTGEIFVCYRRDETKHSAGRLALLLRQHYGVDRVFIDVESIEPGLDFAEAIDRAISRCDVLLAVIGDRWLALTEKRLDDPEDYVALEIQSALARGIKVIPVLVDDSAMPRSADLPPALAALGRRTGLRVRHESFNSDVRTLITIINGVIGNAPTASTTMESAASNQQQGVVAAPTVTGSGAGGWVISRADPGCVVVLLDRSATMAHSAGPRWRTMSEIAAATVNTLIMELSLRSSADMATVRHYFDVGIFGYGERPKAGGQGIESAMPGKLDGRDIVSLPELADHPLRLVYGPMLDGPETIPRVPLWIDPVHGKGAPLCEAIAIVGGHVFDWASAHPQSAPPIVVNITGGVITDDPYLDATLADWMRRLTSIETTEGPVLVVNVLLTPQLIEGTPFPASARGLSQRGAELYAMSSPLPAPLVTRAAAGAVPVAPGARAFVHNVDAQIWIRALLNMLPFGTRVEPVPVAGDSGPSLAGRDRNWPTREDYVLAIQRPDSMRSEALRTALFDVHPAFGIPMPAAGTSAVVFKALVEGRKRAVRFFVRPTAMDRSRCDAVASYVARYDLLGAVAAPTWIDRAVEIDGAVWPAEEMPWVEGRTLDAHIEYLVETGDTISLGNLAASWRRIVGRLQDAQFAHGDLQHGSILVDEPAALRLVDIDAAWTPSIAALRAPYESGHPNYALERSWGRWMDTFPALVIYVSLLAVGHRPELWTRFHQGDNLVFTRPDLTQPAGTPLWTDLQTIEDEPFATALSRLKESCEPDWTAAKSLEALLAST